ncbi:MAG: hypothetical protein ABFD64_00980 [Armatimonadota bacterium]
MAIRSSNTSKRKQALDVLAAPFDKRLIEDVRRQEERRKGKSHAGKHPRVFR